MPLRNSLSIKLIKLAGEQAIVWVNIPDGGITWMEIYEMKFNVISYFSIQRSMC